MRAVLASVIWQYLPERYSHLFFSSEPHNNDWRGSKFYHVACPPSTRGKSSMKGKNGHAKIRRNSRFSPGKIGYIVISHIFGGKFYYGKNHSHFSGVGRGWGRGTTRGKKLLSGSTPSALKPYRFIWIPFFSGFILTDVLPHNVCYGDLGCFNSGPPFLSTHRLLSLVPHSPAQLQTQFLLYTR